MTVVFVSHRRYPNNRYRCIWILARGERTLKCGYCSTGTMIPKVGDKCAVCRAVVSEIEQHTFSEG